MATNGIPVVWICGASGSGKSVAGWALFEQLAADGIRVAYVDIDQLAMLYPAPSDDPDRHGLAAQALAGLLPGYSSTGAQVVVVSGVVDARVGPAGGLNDENLTLCLLSPGPAALRERIRDRGWNTSAADDAVAEDATLRCAAFPDTVINTAGLSVPETVARLRDFVLVTEPTGPAAASLVTSPARTPVVIITGPRAVGTSTVGFGLAMGYWRAGRRTGFVDLQQLGFVAGPAACRRRNRNLGINQLAVMHTFLAARGACRMVVSGHLGIAERTTLRECLPAAEITVIRLRADAATFRSHVRARAAGSDVRLAGDDLLGAPSQHRRAVVAAALAEQGELDAGSLGDAVVDVTARSPADVLTEVERIVAKSG